MLPPHFCGDGKRASNRSKIIGIKKKIYTGFLYAVPKSKHDTTIRYYTIEIFQSISMISLEKKAEKLDFKII